MGNKIRRSLSKELYFLAIFYTVLLLAIGFTVGFVYDRYLAQDIENDINVLSDLSLTSEVLYALEGSDEFCEVYPYTIKEVEEQTWRIGVLLDKLEKENRLDKRIKQRYFDMEIRDYFLTKRAYESCNIESVSLLYFYTNDKTKCFSCNAQGYELTIARNELTKENKTIKIYAFDGEYENKLLSYLKDKYEIEKYPTIIVLYRDKYEKIEGLTGYEDILNSVDEIMS